MVEENRKYKNIIGGTIGISLMLAMVFYGPILENSPDYKIYSDISKNPLEVVLEEGRSRWPFDLLFSYYIWVIGYFGDGWNSLAASNILFINLAIFFVGSRTVKNGSFAWISCNVFTAILGVNQQRQGLAIPLALAIGVTKSNPLWMLIPCLIHVYTAFPLMLLFMWPRLGIKLKLMLMLMFLATVYATNVGSYNDFLDKINSYKDAYDFEENRLYFKLMIACLISIFVSVVNIEIMNSFVGRAILMFIGLSLTLILIGIPVAADRYISGGIYISIIALSFCIGRVRLGSVLSGMLLVFINLVILKSSRIV